MKLLILDGNSILNRAFYGIRLLTTKDGFYTNGIYGFLTMLQKLLDETQPDAVAIAFDLPAPTFRHKAYAGYKASRKGMPQELAQQLPELKELLRLLGYRLVECEGFEADDILGTLARACREQGAECVIATGDRDSLQLVAPGVTVRLASTKGGQPQAAFYDEAAIRGEYGVEPAQLVDVKALQGDASDNIPGVKCIGPKGACELIQKFHDIDRLYAHLDSPSIRQNLREKLAAGCENAFLSRELGRIRTDAPIDTGLSHYRRAGGDPPAAARRMAKLELFSLIKRLGLEEAAAVPPPPAAPAGAPGAPWRAAPAYPAALLRQLAGGWADFTAEVANGRVASLRVALGNTVYAVPADADFLREFFTTTAFRRSTHGGKAVFAALERMGVSAPPLDFDTELAGYLLNPSAADYGTGRLAAEYGVPAPAWEGAAPEDLETALLPGLREALGAALEKNGQQPLLREIELPLCKVLARMEVAGFCVDAAGIAAYGASLEAQAAALQSEIYRAAGMEFNILSPRQLGVALFEKLGLPAGKKTKHGYSTNADVLEKLRGAHPVVEMVLSYRTLCKLKSTYCDGLLKVAGPDGRIHSNFHQTETRTGRISSAEPNLQNIPVRTELGRELRRFFRAKGGWLLIDADYSQIELRVLAHLANDANMIAAFRAGGDIHRSTAAQVFHVPEEMVTPLMRSRAKAVNFGIVYGISAFSLAQDIGVTRREADEYIRAYFAHYPGVREYMDRVVEQAKEQGYVETLFGRRRYLPELSSSNRNLRAFGERVARNMPVQGAAADIIKLAMIRVEDRLEKEGLRARLILQVHDELIVEAPEIEAARAAALLKEEMEHAVSLAVPLLAGANMGFTWYDAKG